MAIDEGIVNLIIESIHDRYLSLQKELVRIKEKKYPTPGPYKLLEFIQKANEEIYKHINKIERDKKILKELTEEQIEISLYRYNKLIPYLHVLLSFLKGAEIKDTPAPLIKPLKRLVKRFLPNAEVIFSSSPLLNYSFLELAEHIRGVFSIYFSDILRDFPEYFMVISFPEVEMKNTLLHCVIGHEIGHGLYLKYKISEKLTKLIYESIDKAELDKTTTILFRMLQTKVEKEKKQPSLFPSELQVKEMISSRIDDIVENWVEELSSDGFGICILGPAYYFSFIHFITSCHYINDIAETHPSPKTRILFMSFLMQNKKLNLKKIFDTKMDDFFTKWTKIAKSPYFLRDPIIKLVMDAIHKNLKIIGDEIINSLDGNLLSFDNLSYLDTLNKMLINIIPPNEIINLNTGKIINLDISFILNAGWATYISHFNEFSENVKISLKNAERYDIKSRLNELLLKAIELYEVRKTVEE